MRVSCVYHTVYFLYFWYNHCRDIKTESACRKQRQGCRIFLLLCLSKSFFFRFPKSLLRSTVTGVLAIVFTVHVSTPFFDMENVNEENLPYPGWQYYNITSPKFFWVSYSFQTTFLVLVFAMLIAHDTLFVVSVVYFCGQVNLMKHRLINLPKLKKEMRYKALALIVDQHVSIYRWWKKSCNCLANSCNLIEVLISSLKNIKFFPHQLLQTGFSNAKRFWHHHSLADQ